MLNGSVKISMGCIGTLKLIMAASLSCIPTLQFGPSRMFRFLFMQKKYKKMGLTGPVKTYELKDQSVLADIQETRLGVQSLTWHRAIKWLLSVWNNCPFHDGSIHVRSLHRYGYSIPHHG